MMSRVVVFNLIIGIIAAFQVFTLPYVIFSIAGKGGGGRGERRLDVLCAAVHGGVLSVRHRLHGRHGVGPDRYYLRAFSVGHPVFSEVHNQ